MCRYRYNFYPSCQHQETVLVQFCERAPAYARYGAPSAITSSEEVARPAALTLAMKLRDEWKEDKRKKKNHSNIKREKRNSRSSAQEQAQQPQQPLPSASSPLQDQHQHPDHKPRQRPSYCSIGSETITEEPLLEEVSQHPDQAHPSTTEPGADSAVDTMAGLRPFSSVRNMMFGTPQRQADESRGLAHAVHTQQEDADTTPRASPTRRQQPGIRANTDESCELIDSTYLLQHLASECPDINSQHVGTDERRVTSNASTIGYWEPESQAVEGDSLHKIAAQLDDMRLEVDRLMKESDNIIGAGGHLQPDAQSTPEAKPESKAAWLLQRHESHEKKQTQVTEDPEVGSVQLESTDFPAFSGGKGSSPHAAHSARGGQPGNKKPSYATAAVAGIKNVTASTANTKAGGSVSSSPFLAQNFDSTMRWAKTGASSRTSDVSSERRVLDADEFDRSVIVSTSNNRRDNIGNEPVAVSKIVPSEPNGQPAKTAPHFAQPTKSFARRAGETLRKDSVLSTASRSPERSTAKTIKGQEPQLEAKTRAGQHKRKSLPGDWLSSPEDGAASTSPATDDPVSSPVMISPSSKEGWEVVHGTRTIKDGKSPVTPPSPQLRKKTSSYMSPTAATVQRTIATLGDENVKHTSARVKPAALQVNTTHGQHSNSPASPKSNTLSPPSNSSSYHTARHRAESSSTTSPLCPRNDRRELASRPAMTRSNSSGARSHPTQSKIPRARASTMAQSRETSVVSPKAPRSQVGQNLVPEVATSMTRRRGSSHAEILKPIYDKLDKLQPPVSPKLRDALQSQGLLKENATATDARKTELAARHDIRVGIEVPRQVSAALEDVVLLTRQGVGIKKPVLPPHLRGDRVSSSASGNSDVVARSSPASRAASTSTSIILGTQPGTPAEPADSAARKVWVVQSQADISTQSKTSGTIDKLSPASSLRATAQEFTPIWKPETMPQKLSLLSWQGKVDSTLALELPHLTPELKPAFEAFANRSPSPSKAAERRFWGELMAQSGDVASTGSTTTSPDGVQAGQVLKPTFSPGKKTVRWTLCDKDGQEKPVSFGRAPPPTVDLGAEGDHPAISPTSDDTTPRGTPQSARAAWTIGPHAMNRTAFGWKGGDGKEISFRGYGPHAERDPNVPVNMQFYHGQAASQIGSGGFDQGRQQQSSPGTGEYNSPTPRVWPRSRKQWAEFTGLNQMTCGNVEIVQATEMIPPPFAPSVGYCHSCVY